MEHLGQELSLVAWSSGLGISYISAHSTFRKEEMGGRKSPQYKLTMKQNAPEAIAHKVWVSQTPWRSWRNARQDSDSSLLVCCCHELADSDVESEGLSVREKTGVQYSSRRYRCRKGGVLPSVEWLQSGLETLDCHPWSLTQRLTSACLWRLIGTEDGDTGDNCSKQWIWEWLDRGEFKCSLMVWIFFFLPERRL